MYLRPLPILLTIVAVILLVAIAFVSISYFRYTSEDAVLNYIRDHPGDVAIACLDPARPEAGLYHNAGEAYPLASTFKLIFLAAYAENVSSGTLDPQESVPVTDLEAYYLPETDGGAHAEFLNSLGANTRSLTLGQVVDGMIVYSSNAAADYIYSRVRDTDFPVLYQRLSLENTDLPFTFLGLYLFMSNHETGAYAQEELTLEEARAEQKRLEGLFVHDLSWREAELEFLRNQGNFAPLTIQKEVLNQFGMKGSARDLAGIMQAAYGYNDGLPAAMQDIMRRHLEWPIRLDPVNAGMFEVLAAKSGAWPSVLTSAWYAETLRGERRVLSVLYREMPDDFWNAWLVSFSQQVLESRVLTEGDCSILSDVVNNNQ